MSCYPLSVLQFDSLAYVVLLALTFGAFYLAPGRLRIPILVGASFAFYAFWNWAFFGLILVSAVVDFFASRRIASAPEPKARRRWLAASVCVNLGLLGFFKYTNFILEAVRDATGSESPGALDIVLPIGISFYTFQTMSYTIDVYRGRISPTGSFGSFLLYVSFFPQLVAGPIERASHLLPQLLAATRARLESSNLATGLLLITWGLMKKMALADNLAHLVDPVYAGPANASGLDALLATYAFALQIFFDFSAYSDIARGSAALFGIKLVRNFKLPYLATSPSDFWRRWHVSLSEWIRDYVYISLGGGRRGRARTLLNLAITMALAGLWHGAAWHFCAWGLFHGALLVVWRVFGPLVRRLTIAVPAAVAHSFTVVLMFHLVCAGWVLFRANDLGDAHRLLTSILTWAPGEVALTQAGTVFLCFTAVVFALMLWEERTRVFSRMAATEVGWVTLTIGSVVVAAVLAPAQSAPFIYFQF